MLDLGVNFRAQAPGDQGFESDLQPVACTIKVLQLQIYDPKLRFSLEHSLRS